MSNKMLIDASHPEETRVAVVRGNRIEEFDFESQEKKQLRGNIYLAKVTRVEPSLQAAFVDYGGNRHGFLAFSEIHPDYYQIPVADRQALLEAEAMEARALREAEEAEDDDTVEEDEVKKSAADDTDNDDEAEKPKPKRRRTRSKSATKKADKESDKKADNAETESETTDDQVEAKAPTDEDQPGSAEETSEEKKPKRRATRRRKVKEEPAEETSASEETSSDEAAESTTEESDDKPNGSTTMSAVVEIDEISEPLPGEEDESPEEEQPSEDDVEEAPVAKKAKPKRTTRSRKKKAEPAEEEAQDVEADAAPSEEEAAVEATSDDNAEEAKEEKEKKPRRRSSRRSSGRKKSAAASKEEAEDTAASDQNDDDDEDQDAPEQVESVGQEDALEELPAQRRNYRQYKIQEVIKRRQVLLIQVVKEERGNKGAALTTYLSLAGRYSVLMPNTARGGGISRKITNSADRKRLKTIAAELEVPEGMGVILRTAGAARTKDEIERDFQYLMRLWEQVRNLTLASTAPCLVYEEGSLIKRSIRDLYNKDTDEIIVSGEDGHKEAHSFMEMLMPEHVDRVKLYGGAQAIFNKYGVENHLENMVSPQVTLKSGGYLVINQTEALVAVDVNSGRATREHSVEKTALQTNLEAAEEVARQLRLRDLAGLIVIDFIDMEERRNNRAVEKKLKDCLKNDRARIQVGRISHFGLMEMSRQRIRASVLESTMDICPHCAGTGYVRSESAMALHIFRALEEHVSRNRNRDAILKTTPQIATHLLNYKRAALVELEIRYKIQVIVLGESGISGQDFKIEKGDKSRSDEQSNVVGYDGDMPSSSEPSEGDGKRKRPRKRRKKGSTEETAENNSDQEVVEASEADSGDEGDKPRRKRRRGKRGGSRRNEGDENTIEASEETSEAPEKSATNGVDEKEPVTEAAETVETEAEADEKPKTRSTRRKKAPIAKAKEQETSDTAEAAATEEQPAAPPPPKPRRRTTRRVKSEAEDSATEAAAKTADPNMLSEPLETPSADIPIAEATADAGGVKEDETSDEKPKRKSWWSRGEGFF